LVINEILAEPFNDAASEYIELYNRSDRSLSLTGVGIAIKKTDGTTGTVYPLFDITLTTIEPDSYIVLTKQASGVTDYYQVKQPETVIEVKLPVLNNEGATIAILNITDLSLIDEVSYTSKYHDASLKSNKGVSLERISPDVSSQEASNWASATSEVGYGTPGGKNSQYLSSEAAANSSNRMQAPIYIAGFDRYVITYQTSKAGFRCRAEVYSVNGNKVAEISNNHLLSQEGEISWDGKGLNNARLTRGVYIFYAELYHPDGNQQRIKQAFTVH